MKGYKKYIIGLMILTLIISCEKQERLNPLDPLTTVQPSQPIASYGETKALDSSSKEGKEWVNFNWGEHTGELKYLEMKVVYKDPYFYDSNGYPVYYIGLPMKYEIRIKNTGNRMFKHLDVVVIQEYYETKIADRWWYPYPRYVQIHKGDPLPDESVQVWSDVTIGPHEELVLEDTYIPPISTCAGLNQTHLILRHTNQGIPTAAVIYDNPELGIFCPPPPQ